MPHPANLGFAMETKREAAFSTKVRSGKVTTHPGWYVRVFDGVQSARGTASPFSAAILVSFCHCRDYLEFEPPMKKTLRLGALSVFNNA